MNRITYHIAFVLLLLAAACSKEPAARKGPVPSDVPIEFGVPQTKGAEALSTLDRLATQKFGVNAWYTPEGETFGDGDASSLYIRNHRFGRLNETWCGLNSAGEADPVYYPLDGTLSYFCYAPYRQDVSGTSDVNIIFEPDAATTSLMPNYMEKSPLICFTPSASPSTQIDFVAALPVIDVNRTSGSVPLDLTHHLTTNIQFFCKYSGVLGEGEYAIVSEIVIRDVIKSEYLYFTESGGIVNHAWCDNVSPEDGTSNMPTGSYTLNLSNGALSEANLNAISFTNVNETINGVLYLLPQSLPLGASLSVSFIVRNTSSILDETLVNLPLSGVWPAGKTIRYYITVSVQPRQTVNIDYEILEWQDAANHHSVQELLH